MVVELRPVPSRRLENWIDSFLEYTSKLPSPPIIRKWAGIMAIAGALERRVYTQSLGKPLHPHLYVILCGPPGVGKSIVLNRVAELWHELEGQHVASSSVTRASLIDELKGAQRSVIVPGEVPLNFHSLKVASSEFGVFLHTYDNDFMSTLTDLWDGNPYRESRRTHELKIAIESPQLNIIAATTPSYLKSLMPEGAWDQGFTSRVLIIYSGEQILVPLFSEEKGDGRLWGNLINDLKMVGKLQGRFTWAQEAVDGITTWHMEGGPPKPDHPKLLYYNTRRSTNLLKLCMVASAARSDTLRVEIDDLRTALDWLIEAETYMPDVFKSMSNGGDIKVVDECWHFAYKLYMSGNKKPVREGTLAEFLLERVPAHNVQRLLQAMEQATLLRKVIGPDGGNAYEPLAFRHR